MANSYPRYVAELYATKYTPKECAAIDKYWSHYANQHMSFGSSTNGQLLREAKTVLECVRIEHKDELL